MELEVFRGVDVVATITTGGKNAMFSHGLMNQHKIVVSDVRVADVLDIQIEDYITLNGIKFKVNTVPDLNADDQLTYNITFEGPKYTWHDKLFLDEGEAEFTYYGNAFLLMTLFLTNINEIDPGWTLGEVTDTPEKHITFSNVTCHEAILLIAEEFGLEFDNIDKEITMIPKIGRDTALSFEYGMGNGLYNLTRNYVSDKNVVTKVYGFGGTRNLPAGYRGGKRRLTFDPGYHTNNIELYGIKEGQYTNDEIVPEREGTATGVTYGNPSSTLTDSSLDFDILDAVIEGLEPKIGFTTGDLAGEEFVITDYNPTTKVITYKGYVNSNNIVLPNETFQAAIGDKYVLYDMDLPESYVTAGEDMVDDETLQYVLENSVPRVEYGGTMDPIHYRDNSLSVAPGDRVNFKDTRLGLDATIRITEISYPLDFILYGIITDEDAIQITIANFVTYTAQQRLRDEKLIQRHEVKTIDLRSAEQARRNSANLLNLRDSVIDPEGNYYTEKIKPGSIETLFLSVGAKATNFNISGVSFEPNVDGDPNSFAATAGQLIHYDLKLPDTTFVWEMAAYNITGLVDASKYYLYAKISKSTNVGTWELATDVKLAESIAGFWILQAGVLFPVLDGRRDNAITKGMVFIVGDQITAGRIKSLDESMFIDLTTGQMSLGNEDSGMDWNVTTPDRLTIRGGITQNAGGISAPITTYRGPYVPGATYYNGDTATFGGTTWLYKNITPTNDQAPSENAYWTVYAQKGVDGADGLPGVDGTDGTPGPAGSNGQTSYFHLAYADSADGTVNFNQTGGSYIGTYVDFSALDSSDPADYNWVLFKGADGADGTNGIPGVNGADGQTSYLHIKYSNDAGATFTASSGETPGSYLGQYVDFTLADSTDPAAYTWSLIKGTDGTNGTNGTNGSDGNYTEFRFAKNGSTTVAPSIVSTDADPSGWTVAQPTLGAAEYGWITSALKTSAGALVGTWSPPTRFTGLKGETGDTGAQGPFLNYRGDFDAGKTYVGSATNIQAVKYGSDYYVTRTDAGTITPGTLPTDTSKWNAFGGQFESVATDLLLATLAYIENLGVRNIKTAESGTYFEMTEAGQNLSFFRDDKLILNVDADSAVQNGTYEDSVQVFDSNGNGTWIGTRYDVPTATVMYIYPNSDVGIAIGYGINDADGFTAVGRKKVFTTGSFEASNAGGTQKTTITKDGIDTTGTLNVDGNGVFEANLNIKGSLQANGTAGGTGSVRVAAFTSGGLKRIHELVYSKGLVLSFNDLGIAWS